MNVGQTHEIISLIFSHAMADPSSTLSIVKWDYPQDLYLWIQGQLAVDVWTYDLVGYPSQYPATSDKTMTLSISILHGPAFNCRMFHPNVINYSLLYFWPKWNSLIKTVISEPYFLPLRALLSLWVILKIIRLLCTHVICASYTIVYIAIYFYSFCILTLITGP